MGGHARMNLPIWGVLEQLSETTIIGRAVYKRDTLLFHYYHTLSYLLEIIHSNFARQKTD